MIELNQLYTNNIYGKIGCIAILLISLIHILGFIKLETWFNFAGIGDSTERMKSNYGYWSIVILNLAATLLFLIIPYLYVDSIQSGSTIIAVAISITFIIRGLFGNVMALAFSVGTATKQWQVVFSSVALIIGIFLLIGIQMEV